MSTDDTVTCSSSLSPKSGDDGPNSEEKPVRPPAVDLNLVQIQADNTEIQRRISAFMQKKRADIDEINRREFCSVTTEDGESDGCARTNSVFTPHSGGLSRVRVTRVINQQGPQTMPQYQPSPKRSRPSVSISTADVNPKEEVAPPAVEERLVNMEKHLKISDNTAPSGVYSRIKALEERILHLESLSPEYFQQTGITALSSVNSMIKQQWKAGTAESGSSSMDMKYQGLSSADLDSRIQSLKQSLLQKQPSLQSRKEAT